MRSLRGQNKQIIKRQIFAVMCMLTFCVQSISSVNAQGVIGDEPAQVPLILSGTFAEPNIMFIFDDSGSMISLSVPDDLGSWAITSGSNPFMRDLIHPEDTYRTYGGLLTFTPSYMIATGFNDALARIYRSPQINKLYYNPATTYTPWKNADGSWVFPGSANDGNIDPTSAPVSVLNPGLRRVNLTLQNASYTPYNQVGYCSWSGAGNPSCRTNGAAYTYTPAVYYIYTPGAVNWSLVTSPVSAHPVSQQSNYTQVIIPALTANIKQPGTRTDCGAPNADGTVNCTPEQEMQNFANWFSYYRGRTRAAIGSVLRAFEEYDSGFRLGWAALNSGGGTIDGQYQNYMIQGVRELDATHKQLFFNWVMNFERDLGGGTPLQGALDAVGQYYSRTDSRGPWGTNPATGQNDNGQNEPSSAHSSCRKSYAIAVTDGLWNTVTAGRGNADGTPGSPIARPDGTTYTYIPTAPFQDNVSNTLADVAMYYWKRDLRPDLVNDLVPTAKDPAFWQHMVTHVIGMGMSGNLTFPDDQALIDAGTVVWPTTGLDTNSGSVNKVDDLWHTAVNGHGTYNSASNVEELVNSLSNILESVQEQQTSTPYSVTTTDYVEEENRAFVTSYVSAQWTGELARYKLNGSGGVVEPPEWFASDGIPEASLRNIWIGMGDLATSTEKAIEFKWSEISSKPDLASILVSEDLVDYLRGEEKISYRSRNSVLGDIVHSIPVYLKKTEYFKYALLPSVASDSKGGYTEYHKGKKDRNGVVFIGANDGMLHAFANEGVNEGKEIFAFIPNGVAPKMQRLSDAGYDVDHQYFVDGLLSVTDAYWGACDIATSQNCWHNVLMGSTGAGAKSVYALDVTDPSVYGAYESSISQTNANKTILWELSPTSTGMSNLGHVMQSLQGGFAKNDQWVAIFPNGSYSAAGIASLFIVDMKTGSLVAEVATDSSITSNGLLGVTLIRNEKQVVVGAYAGDLKGNLWKFDLASSDKSNWKSKKIFTSKNNRPIFQQPVYTGHPLGGNMVLFGTGKFYDALDLTDSSMNSLYGIWDKDGSTVSVSSLLKREAVAKTISGQTYHVLKSNAAIDWTTHKGWTLELNMFAMQKSLYPGNIIGSNVIFNTTAVADASAAASGCGVGGLSGVPVVLELFGGGLPSILTDTNNDGDVNGDDIYVIGFPPGAEGNSTSLTAPGNSSKVDDGSFQGGIVCPAGQIYMTIGDMPSCVTAKNISSIVQMF